VWRKSDNSPSGYNTWRMHFGESVGGDSGGTLNTTVPEPATVLLIFLAATGWRLRRGRAA
jgi:hypothetical protein